MQCAVLWKSGIWFIVMRMNRAVALPLSRKVARHVVL